PVLLGARSPSARPLLGEDPRGVARERQLLVACALSRPCSFLERPCLQPHRGRLPGCDRSAEEVGIRPLCSSLSKSRQGRLELLLSVMLTQLGGPRDPLLVDFSGFLEVAAPPEQGPHLEVGGKITGGVFHELLKDLQRLRLRPRLLLELHREPIG